MIRWSDIARLVFGQKAPPIPNVARPGNVLLPSAGLTMGTFVLGKQGTGKTSYLGMHLVDNFKAYPDRAIFLIDWSGSLTDTVLRLILQESPGSREWLLSRVIYDELGHPNWVVPFPEFSHLYGTSYEEQINRVKDNWVQLANFLAEGATVLGGVSMKGLAPAIMRVLVSIGAERDKPWQVTEFGRFVEQSKSILPRVFKQYRDRIPKRTREMLTRRLVNVKDFEQELRTYALSEILSAIETPVATPRLGYHRPGWTPREAIRKGMMVIINGARLINQRSVQHYLFTQVYSIIMSEINKRLPADPNDQPASIVMDEVFSLLQIPGMAEQVGMIGPIYRSRKVQLYIVVQTLSQLDELLSKQVWSLGNAVVFSVENFHEAIEVAKQLLKYQPKMVKQEPRTETQNPTTEPIEGQYTIFANWIQNMVKRECIIRQYLSESEKDTRIRYLQRTPDLPARAIGEPLAVVKERLLRQRGVSVSEALEVVGSRTLKSKKSRPSI